MSHRHQSGRATGSIVLLLALLSGLGAWNYHRNWQIEQETEGPRPYASYASEDLRALRDAFGAEPSGERARFEAAQQQRRRPKGDLGSISGNVDQFAETTRTSRQIRQAAAGVAEHENEIAELDRELELRDRFGQGMMRHVKRLTTI